MESALNSPLSRAFLICLHDNKIIVQQEKQAEDGGKEFVRKIFPVLKLLMFFEIPNNKILFCLSRIDINRFSAFLSLSVWSSHILQPLLRPHWAEPMKSSQNLLLSTVPSTIAMMKKGAAPH